ncbi:signal peptidase II [Candidatus Karelsulcia muelleri]|uniref:signal peptidase II n=1 Tax=Candidatus Karelsulcia muelleri TaxID=336810 RepID=UPI0036F19BE5
MIKFYLITLILINLDQILKIYVKTNLELGQSLKRFKWLKFFFIENPGIGYGYHLKYGDIEKIIISIIRTILIVIYFIYFYRNRKNIIYNYLKISICLLLAGSISNLLDCFFYGVIFNQGLIFTNKTWTGYEGISKFILYKKKGYSFFMCGCVVDMLYFPIFNVIFNIADTCISIGGLIFLLLPRLDSNQRHPD